ncbi:mandelate racemase/muconate lactonizing enzyme family protein [Hirschia baltica]|uniref:Mandelate racemase/muconate lactonizing protein n=1 Tax=Hirschia baltica (strain ATCC 49814 / DSM 5838 / IFAM 1418) TaxID=582402 RepID=C6XPU3_HIRBI|nr:mandelate racemase/muconate lactonizing enzyme family protein [Hirschia baltica]ACT60358.1 Mandelate racemase/muconate lactonizing protein [Hirschia baltica ATCC 49814]
MPLVDYRITRFQFARDRIVGDSQVRASHVHVATLELIDSEGHVGLGFAQSLFHPLPSEEELIRTFDEEVWPNLKGQPAIALAHQVKRPRGGHLNRSTHPFGEAIQHALWDVAAKAANLPLWKMLGAKRSKVRAYASGLDYHLSDDVFCSLFTQAADQGYTGFKIKVGAPEIERDIHRLDLLKQAIGPNAKIMIDANEAWSPKEAIQNLDTIRRAGHEIYWLEDPILRFDIEGLKLLRETAGNTLINSGEYLDVSGKRALIQAHATDMLNVHGHFTDVMRIGWLAADMGVPITVGNTFLELGVNVALALPEVEWLEYSFQNFEHLVETPYKIEDGFIYGSETPGHGLVLCEDARQAYRQPIIIDNTQLGPAPAQQRLALK